MNENEAEVMVEVEEVVEVEVTDHVADDLAEPTDASDVVPSPGAAEIRRANRARWTWTLPSLPRGASQARRLCPEQPD